MTALAVTSMALLLLASAFIALDRVKPSPLRSRSRSRVLVTLKTGAAFDGVLFESDRRLWVLRSAQAIGAGDRDTNVPVDGEVLIFTADIEFVQKP